MSRELARLNTKVTCLEKYGVEEYFSSEAYKQIQTPEYKEARLAKAIQTKHENNSFNTSKGEVELHDFLVSKYGEDNVITNYQDPRYARETGYRFKCDFYIKSEDLFIELNLHPTHGEYPFDINNEEDLTKLYYLENSERKWDQNVAKVWGYLDVEKVNIAKKNNLNHRMVYNLDEFYRELQC